MQSFTKLTGITAFAIALFLATGSALAGPSAFDVEQRKAANMPPEWFVCKTTQDCTLVSVWCGPNSLAANVAHEKEALAALEKKHGKFQGCDASMPDDSVPVCDKGECVTLSDHVKAEERRKKTPEVNFKLDPAGAVPVPNPSGVK